MIALVLGSDKGDAFVSISKLQLTQANPVPNAVTELDRPIGLIVIAMQDVINSLR